MDTGKSTRAAIAAVLLATCLALTTVPVWADDPPSTSTTTQATDASKDAAKVKTETVAQTASDTKPKPTGQASADIKSGNTLFICRCGMAFMPSIATKSVSHEGGQYRTCSEACFKAASADPAKAAAESQAHMKRILAQTAAPDNAGTQAPKPN